MRQRLGSSRPTRRVTQAGGVWRGPVAASASAAAGVLVTTVLGLSAPGVGAPAAVQLTASEFLYDPRDVTAPAGVVSFMVKNGGTIQHNFVLEDQARKRRLEIPVLEPGQTLQASAVLQAGVYVMYCSLPGHRDAGMVAMLYVY